ncbi:flagellar assembly protein FliW [uncultured Helicobacter sp.]|uniref:flagellar assembly protein FliW n=1 Tax=uncultured Helicobacter sp. TaxID=175537 RepID=UPI0027DCDBCF|nr:flagellar assembly protein FliW [uncultured Helicobacter sp.]
MEYEFKAPVLGFEYITRYEFEKIDEYFAKITQKNKPKNTNQKHKNKNLSQDSHNKEPHKIDSQNLDTTPIEIMLINPYALREYSFKIPKYIELLLGITSNSQIEVYCPLTLHSHIQDSTINFLAPIVFHLTNKQAAQVALSMMDYPNFGFKESLQSFLKER